MDILIAKKDILRALGRVHALAKTKGPMPLLANILIEAKDDGITCSATDLYQAARTKAACKVKRDGIVALPSKTLFDVVKNLPEGEVSITVDRKNYAAQVKTGKIKFRIPGMPGEDFPPLPSCDAPFAEIPYETISNLIGLTHFSMSNDDTRPHLNGALFEFDGKEFRMATTDGHRLSLGMYAAPEVPLPNQTFKVLVPSKGVHELKRLAEDVKAPVGVAIHLGNIFFRAPDVELSVKLADEQFPPYQKVIPASYTRRVVVARALLVDALKRVGLVASDKSGGVRLIFQEGKLDVESEHPDIGEGSEELAVDYVGARLAIGANVRYLLESLSALPDDEVALELGGELDPLVVKPVVDQRSLSVIMPMRLGA